MCAKAGIKKKLVPRKAAPLKRQSSGGTSPLYPAPPAELSGKWVVWSHNGRIIASGATLSNVVDQVTSKKIIGASYERLPANIRTRAD